MRINNIFFSASGNSAKVADYFGKALNIPEMEVVTLDITPFHSRESFDYSIWYDLVILSFPVYSQNIPTQIKNFLKKLQTRFIIFNATYGTMSYGNVLYEAAKLTSGKVIGLSVLASNHTYINLDIKQDLEMLKPLVEKVKKLNNGEEISEVCPPKRTKNIFASFLLKLRSYLGVKIIKTNQCNNCNLCSRLCPAASINNGVISSSLCIRCFKCVNCCPKKALKYKITKPLKWYLKKPRIIDSFVLI